MNQEMIQHTLNEYYFFSHDCIPGPKSTYTMTAQAMLDHCLRRLAEVRAYFTLCFSLLYNLHNEE